MSKANPVVTLFASEVVRVEDFVCAGHDGEDCAHHHEIVFPRSGMYVRRDATGQTTADVNRMIFFHAAQGFDITHPVNGGDHSTVLVLAPTVLIDILAQFDP